MSLVDRFFRMAARIAAPGGARARLTVLFYHRVLAAPDPLLPTEPDATVFDAHMRAVASMFCVLPLDEAVERLGNGTLPARAACITFDDGYRDNFEIACPILQRHGLVATFFIASDFLDHGRMFNDTVLETARRLPDGPVDLSWIGLGTRPVGDAASRAALMTAFLHAVKYLPADERDAACERFGELAGSALPDTLMLSCEQVLGLKRAGMDIGGHTLGHPILAKTAPEEARRQIVGNHERLTALLGAAPRHFAYPNGRPALDYGAEHVLMVREAGYVSAVSTARGVATPLDDRFQLPRFAPWHQDATRLRASLVRNALNGANADRVPVATTAGTTARGKFDTEARPT